MGQTNTAEKQRSRTSSNAAAHPADRNDMGGGRSKPHPIRRDQNDPQRDNLEASQHNNASHSSYNPYNQHTHSNNPLTPGSFSSQPPSLAAQVLQLVDDDPEHSNSTFDLALAQVQAGGEGGLSDLHMQAAGMGIGMPMGRGDVDQLRIQYDTLTLNTESEYPERETVVPHTFKWEGEGENVYVSGSFNGWQGKTLLNKVAVEGLGNARFSLVMDLPPGEYYYRFIVDDEWRMSKHQPVAESNGYRANKLVVNQPVFEDYSQPYSDSDEDEYLKPSSTKSGLDGKSRTKTYSQVIPDYKQYDKQPRKLPPQLTSHILNRKATWGSVDPLVLPIPSHVNLNHLYVNTLRVKTTKDGDGNVLSKSHTIDDSEVSVTSVTQRFKTKNHARSSAKFVTTIFLSPAPKDGFFLNRKIQQAH
jgi:hypothetical protein